MPCGDDMKTLLSRYVDGELPKEDRARAEDHLLSCEPCRELLGLFQKNENLVASALSTDAFGEAMIESVVRKISRVGPPEAKPVDEGVIEWVRERPWLPVAAGALFAVVLAVVLNSGRSAEIASLKTELGKEAGRSEALAEKNRKTESELQNQLSHSVAVEQELGRLDRDWKTDRAIKRAPEGTVIGYLETPHYLVAKASFGDKPFAGFNVYRRLEGEKDDTAWKKLNTDLLLTPEFADRTVRPGQGYLYKFHAITVSGQLVESVPLILKVPFAGEFSPEKSIWVHCQDLSAPKDLAVFILERVVNGRKLSAKFYTEPGKTIGGRSMVDGVEIDFTTDLVLARIESGTEPLYTSVTEPVLDKDGNPMMVQLVGPEFIAATRRYERSIGQRENKKAVLRLAGTTGPKSEQDLWRGSRIQVLARGE